jgi:hypothetical protein
MLCITVNQPYASRLVTGQKRHEVRGQPIAVGTVVAIHSARRKSDDAEAFGLPRGAIVGVVTIERCERRREGGYVWWLTAARCLERPLPVDGNTGVWTLPEVLEGRLLAGLRTLGRPVRTAGHRSSART